MQQRSHACRCSFLVNVESLQLDGKLGKKNTKKLNSNKGMTRRARVYKEVQELLTNQNVNAAA